jgi:hypothetical protein
VRCDIERRLSSLSVPGGGDEIVMSTFRGPKGAVSKIVCVCVCVCVCV